ncbi:cysteine desulfurase family protein [Sphingobacterium psychroaquaticum]|uniref:cysteine desulfurase n=1 Tax=Sphingobacterium psychroaquaticum TaxID=561061 RepID=A0A1X7J2A8_9SPHI|nr:cysteine desulfurase family protein [Sphingobacterium psychroaquaticum]QBQ40143.1 cysteine desulfurase [Sphingobacterium psychroaquaticum]SMG21723.1 cysteine desulfurase [Sphingobacterium psychroaquaticum]
MKVYLDNAATTPLDPEVIKVMTETMQENYGNPSSIHAHGRQVKTIVEKARKTVAHLLKASPAEIFFTSGGTEADNMAIVRSIMDLGIKHAITSPVEHHAVLHTLEEQEKLGNITLNLVRVDAEGNVDLAHLRELLAENPRTFVSLMHANNEIGNLTDIKNVSQICREFNAVFHSDTVQTMGHYPHDLTDIDIDFITGAGHKFHGPKGVGFLYINAKNKIKPMIYGGAQERNMRGGTENVYGIVGLAKALEISYEQMAEHHAHIQALKEYMKEELQKAIPDVRFNGVTTANNSLYTVLNVSLPCTGIADMLLFSLDIAGVSASGGSACSSGSEIGSHVLQALNCDASRPSVRFSFSKYNTKEDIDFAVKTLKDLCEEK